MSLDMWTSSSSQTLQDFGSPGDSAQSPSAQCHVFMFWTQTFLDSCKFTRQHLFMMAFFALTKLVDKKLLKITGPDCFSYLQSLLSNDLRYLYDATRIPERKFAIKSPNALSTYMLNPNGKVVCDMILYRTQLTRSQCEYQPPGRATEPDELLIECDSTLASGIANTLYGYRVRRKVSLAIIEDLNLWCLYPILREPSKEISEQHENSLLNLDSNEIITEDLSIVNDPRLASMGLRVISRDKDPDKIKRSLENIINHEIEIAKLTDYTIHRYRIGLAEGGVDIPEGLCFPLECNGDQLNYVSFTKGCYLGQELTSRVYHTGVVRKRLMPIVLDLESRCKERDNIPLVDRSDIVDADDSKKKIGTLRSVMKDRGLALLNHELALGPRQLVHKESKIKLAAYAPYWWDIK